MEIEKTIHINYEYIVKYVKDNIIGLFLLLCTFIIIYAVDYINHLNGILMMASTSSTVPGMVGPLINPLKKHKQHKRRKI